MSLRMDVAWTWVKTHVEWVLTGLVVFLGLLLNVAVRRKGAPLGEKSVVAQKAEAQAQKDLVKAEVVREDARKDAADVHAAAVAAVVISQQQEAPTLVSSGTELTAYLKETGDLVRGDPPK